MKPRTDSANEAPEAVDASASCARPLTVAADALLIQATLNQTDPLALLARLRQLKRVLPHTVTRVHAAWSETARQLYVYFYFDERTPVNLAAVLDFEVTLKNEWPHGQIKDVKVSRLERAYETAGASSNTKPVFHYAVEMDPEAGWMPELSQWYDTEHMPGLASVPGCVLASRFLNHDHGPLSLACYDLVTPEALGSPPWLAVRGTNWSSRMRPRFTHTVRTMFKVL